MAGESAVWDVLIVMFLTVQIKETASQFSTPLYLPPGQKKRGVSGHINYRWRVDVKWGTFEAKKKSKNLFPGEPRSMEATLKRTR